MQATLKELARFSTCDISDALIKLKVRHGGFLSGLTLWSPLRQEGSTRIVGTVYTVKYVLNDDTHAPKLQSHYVRNNLTRFFRCVLGAYINQIDSIPHGAVVFISCPSGVVNAVYGGLMSHRAKASGAAGSIIDGRIRDLQEHRDIGYPVFARDVGISAPYEVVRVSETNVPIRLQTDLQEAWIKPEDIIVGDLNGVVCIPRDLVDQAVSLARSQSEADEEVAKDIQRGATFTEASKKHRAGVLKPEDLPNR